MSMAGFTAWFDMITGVGGIDLLSLGFDFCGASGRVFGGNPPYTLNDFLSIYPKFFGSAATGSGTEATPTLIQATASQATNGLYTITAPNSLTAGQYVALASSTNDPSVNGQVVKVLSANGTSFTFQYGTNTIASASDAMTASTGCNLTNCTLPNGVAVGQLVTGPGIPNGSLVIAFSGSTGSQLLTISQPATLSGAQSGLGFYTAAFVPMLVIQMYINLALASVMQARWQDSWYMAMGLFVAHYCTMYLRSEGGTNATAAQVAASGIEKGITVSKAAGGVSASVQLVGGVEDFGSFAETTYGTQFGTLARVIGAGPVYVG